MSAYGVIHTPKLSDSPLPSTIWPLSASPKSTSSAGSNAGYITIHHVTLSSATALTGLLDYLWQEFAEEIERGATYPQETPQGELYTREAFDSYFFAGDVFIGIVGSGNESVPAWGSDKGAKEIDTGIEDASNGRSWNECVAGCYYVKPNYPGRSSHICNGGFVVSSSHRGAGYGKVLARSYVHYAPRLGYQASVFNLVYVNNVASVRIWESLDFVKAGRIPRAGRLKTKDGKGEEYVDAWVFYRSFVDDADK